MNFTFKGMRWESATRSNKTARGRIGTTQEGAGEGILQELMGGSMKLGQVSSKLKVKGGVQCH